MKKILFTFIAISLLACKNEAKKTDEVKEEEKKTEVSLYTFDGGNVGANNLNLFAQGDTYKGESKQLKNAFYVIKHPKGTLLWDTGLPEGLVGNDPYTTPDGAFTISRKDSILTQLAKANMKIKNIDYIAFSHIHFDHTGAANHFKDAKWLVQQSELEFAHSDAIEGNSFYSPDAFSELKNIEKLNGDHDVFGDGTVVIKSMPGHTAGHQVLYLELPETGPVVLSGDMYHFQENRDNRIIPQFNHDIPQSEESMKAFEAFVKEKNAKVIIQHEPNDFSKMPMAPKAMQ